jgi:hypothetical protein
MTQLETKRRRSRVPPRKARKASRKPENLVAEIVDQITEKQARAAEAEAEKPVRNHVHPAPADSPYQAVLSCSTDEPGSF